MALSDTPDLKAFGELLGYLTCVTPVQRFLIACQKEGGIQEVEKHDVVLDLNMHVSHSDIEHPSVGLDQRTFPLTLRVEALRRAIYADVVANVETLLDQRANFDGEMKAAVYEKWLNTEPEKVQVLHFRLSRQGPRVVLFKIRDPNRIIWQPEQASNMKPAEGQVG